MDSAGLFFISIFAIVFVAFKFAQYKLFEKAGKEGWKALVPVYNFYVWLELIGKPWWWLILLFIPIIGVLVFVAMVIEFAKAYGKYNLGHHAASLILPFYFFPKIALDPKVKYLGAPETHKNAPKKSGLREWGDAFLFAGVAALIIRTFFIEAFMIPTSSMERTLMAGDFLFVSKFHYGSRMPMVPLSVPFIHNKVKIKDFVMPSYLDVLKLPYWRFPGLEKVKRNDIVVFNYPAHDIDDLEDGAGLVQPISMKENYIKRCIAIAGDTLEIKDQQIHINGKPSWNPPNMQYQYQVETNGTGFSSNRLQKYGFRARNSTSTNPNWMQMHNNIFYFYMPDSIAKLIKQFPQVTKVDTVYRKEGKFQRGVYPTQDNADGQLFSFNIDNYGPIVIPQKGMSVSLTQENRALYWRVIEAYEKHEMKVENGKTFIDGVETDTYTFEMNYYFMMGDNRHNSEDSRYWGFVPENHVVGKPLFVFFSYESDFGIRWNRIGTKYVN
ncbi:MAG: signal peptidase I [Bacteroidia bacterium]|nr:signal peptidase I [Bacteroidia bacterium]